MRYHADLHIHSRFSRATSSNCDLYHLAWWARRKGIAVVGTGDFTHPAWRAELERDLVPAEPGLFRLKPELERAVDERLPTPCRGATRFMLSVEISTIYKKNDKSRRIHHLVYAPDFESADRITAALARIGNLKADGRPMLGLDSRHLLEIVLESGPGNYLVPAHVWTPWYAVFGSMSGFDTIDECYGDLASHVFALETGLSSDPAMNWRISKLDRYRLVSSSDAHSPAKLGRETTVFHGELDYFALRRSLETGEGFGGTLEFFPEEGKYHLDGHRACNVRMEPGQTRACGEVCPACGQRMTVGTSSRIDSLADRPAGYRPEGAADFRSMVPLPEILGEINAVGVESQAVEQAYRSLLSQLGSELDILETIPLEDVRRAGSTLLAEGIERMREGRVLREAGYDGVYGTIKLFGQGEIARRATAAVLFEDAFQAPQKIEKKADTPAAPREKRPAKKAPAEALPLLAVAEKNVSTQSVLDGLDADQRAAAAIVRGTLLVIAGPGTGKTRTLTHRIAHLVKEQSVPPDHILAITFTRRAASEMKERLEVLLGHAAESIATMTFHALGLLILREFGETKDIELASDRDREQALVEALTVKPQKARSLCTAISRLKRKAATHEDVLRLALVEEGSELDLAFATYEKALAARGLVDFDDLVARASVLVSTREDVRIALQARWPHISVDELQDIDERQYELLRGLASGAKTLCAIGDPDQAIYGFRGSDVAYFFRFREDFPASSVVRLGKNYRSTRTIVDAALSVIAPSPTMGERILRPLLEDQSRIGVHAARSEHAEAAWVVHMVETLVGGTSLHSFDTGRVLPSGKEGGHSFSDFAILYRTEAQSEALATALARSGMPFERRTHERIAERAAAMAILAQWSRLDAAESLASALRAAAAHAHEDTTEESAFGEPEIDAALRVLLAIAERCQGNATQFRLEAMMDVEVDAWDPRAERISLLTLHASKGLEFRVVFLVGCEDGLLPLRFPGRDADEAEERRLFYVGMTRARERLFLTRAESRHVRGVALTPSVSPYLQEIEARLVETKPSGNPERSNERGKKKQMSLF